MGGVRALGRWAAPPAVRARARVRDAGTDALPFFWRCMSGTALGVPLNNWGNLT
jgi:hypothetical protein